MCKNLTKISTAGCAVNNGRIESLQEESPSRVSRTQSIGAGTVNVMCIERHAVLHSHGGSATQGCTIPEIRTENCPKVRRWLCRSFLHLVQKSRHAQRMQSSYDASMHTPHIILPKSTQRNGPPDG